MLPEFSHIKVDIVLGHKAPHRNTVAELVLRRPLRLYMTRCRSI